MSYSTKHIQEAVALLGRAKYCIALTGAGASTESHIPDFRGKHGLWSKYDPAEFGTISAFKKDPVKIWKMLRELFSVCDTTPNEGHMVMARLEHKGILKGVITQNIDSLHQIAGSKNVVEFHGSLRTLKCLECGKNYPASFLRDSSSPPKCPACETILKPDIVFYDESISATALQQTAQLIAKADTIIVAGTSCQVAPASQIPWQVCQNGGALVEINTKPVLRSISRLSLQGSFSDIMSQIESSGDW